MNINLLDGILYRFIIAELTTFKQNDSIGRSVTYAKTEYVEIFDWIMKHKIYYFIGKSPVMRI